MNCPGDAVDDDVYVDGHNDDPATSTGAIMNGITGVEAANQEHEKGHRKPAEYQAGAAAPAISPDSSWDGDSEDDDARHTRGEETGLVA